MRSKFFYPPEWHKQRGTIFIVPQPHHDWGCCFDEVVESFRYFVSVVSKYQKVYLIGDLGGEYEEIENIPTDDTWTRDTLPLTIFDKNGNRYFLNYQFNGWGGKFDFSNDNLITQRLSNIGFFPKERIINLPYIVEGGAVETNGDILLVTKSSILNRNRNQNSEESRREIENSFYQYLGVEKVVWIDNSYLEGDDTDGHIDMLARFGDRKTILYSLDEVGNELKEKLADFQYIQLPNPKFGEFPATYLNFIFVNGAVLIPTYGVAEDREAIEIFRKIFPDRKVEPINSSIFIRQGGSLHCLTMQLY